MCGILAVLARNDRDDDDARTAEDDDGLLARRGPDYSGSLCGNAKDASARCTMRACVLMMQSGALENEPKRQPLENERFLFVFNGEIYRFPRSNTTAAALLVDDDEDDDDTNALFKRLVRFENVKERADYLNGIEGEFAYILFDKMAATLEAGKDRLGRKSLLASVRDDSVAIASAGEPRKGPWEELCPEVIHSFCLGPDRTLTRTRHARPSIMECAALAAPPSSHPSDLYSALFASVQRRLHHRTLPRPDSFAILFSGGLDSVVLAALCARALRTDSPTIPLINVSFAGESAPDRIVARSAVEELQRVFPLVRWELIAIDVSPTATVEEGVLRSAYPRATVMDFNLACVLWCASAGAPVHARALIAGCGADELFGGYARHRNRRRREGAEGERRELEADMNRLWERNLARDDRAVGFHGKELRLPYLDAEVVRWASSVDYDDEEGEVEDKASLRRLAALELGLPETARRTKRAMQFGSRANVAWGGKGLSGTDAYVRRHPDVYV